MSVVIVLVGPCLVALVLFAIAAVPFVTSLRRARRVLNSPRVQSEATVINKRTDVGGRGQAVQRYYATFQFPDGQRLELMMSGPESGVLAVGDQGTLEWQGPRYRGFAREILR